MYQVKKDGGSGVLFWTNCHSDSTSAQIEKELINSIKSNNFSRFFLVYQPQIEIKTNKVIGCEALLRWVFNGEVISPAIFIPILENSDAIIEVGKFVLGKACEDFKEFQDLLVCVNISLRQINHTDFVNHVMDTVDLFKFPYVYLELEITESVFTDDFKKTCAPLLHLKEMGLKISIDDFGVGYSSLSRLIHLPIDKLKIDGSFMAGLEDNDSARKMVKSVVQIGKTLNLKVIAEGVETKEQVEFLLDIDCDQVQGYYYAKPMKLDDFRVWLAAWTSKYPENKNV
jgi:EAL domain-containing protein (putative c-di-GMP-specific phosphodiesterase class I)